VSTARIIHEADGPVLDMPCPRFGHCHPRPPVHREAPLDYSPRGRTWQWIGTEDAPTIRPSVGCDHKCGQHRVITNGSW
jgi:hypothetical protein